MPDWTNTKLSKYIDIKHGFAFPGSGISTDPCSEILVTPGNFHIGGGFKTDKFKYFRGEIPSEYILRPGQIIVTMTDLSQETDTLGYSAKVPRSDAKSYLHNQRIGLVEFTNSDLHPEFCYWLMRTKDYQSFIVNSASGTSIMHTSPGRIKEFDFFMPPLTEQQAIAEVLSSLDDKIDLLQRSNKTMEQLAEALFRQWFVEQVNEEWESGTLSSIADHVKKSVNPSSYPEQLFQHYSLPAYDSGKKPEISLGVDILSNKYKIESGQVLISKLNPATSRVWYIFSADENSICSTEFQVYSPKTSDYLEYLFLFLKSQAVTDTLAGAASGTSGSHQRVNPEIISGLELPIPDDSTLKRFKQVVSPMMAKVYSNTLQVETLTKMRNALLPKLISGQVRVKTT